MKKVLAVYNTCGISGNENTDYYIRAVNGLLQQTATDVDILISGCMLSTQTKQKLLEVFNGKVFFCWIDEVLPVNVTFNKAVIDHVSQYGEYEWYFYIDSGCHFDRQPTLIEEAYAVASLDDFGMLSLRTDTDSGYNFIFGTRNDRDLFKDMLFYIPLGKAVNLHTQFFSNDLLKYYGKLIPDIFASYCTESVFSFLTAALHKKYAIYRDIVIPHAPMMDGQSAGFSPAKHAAQNNGNYIDHPFKVKSILEIMEGGRPYGLGYEELQGVIMHDKTQFDTYGNAINPNLKEYIRDNLFLPSTLLNYSDINSECIR